MTEQPLKREVEFNHLIPRKITSAELKRDVLVPLLIVISVASFLMNFPAVLVLFYL